MFSKFFGKYDKELEHFKAKESSKETASKHIAKFGLLYLVILILAFIYSATILQGERLAVVTGLITIVAQGILAMEKGITDTTEKDPMQEVIVELIKDKIKTATVQESKLEVSDESIKLSKGDDELVKIDIPKKN